MGEGIGGLWRVSANGQALAGEQADLSEHMQCVAAVLIDRQVREDDVRHDLQSELGAWFRNDVTQMDDQQHSISALLATREILRNEAMRP